MTRKQRRLILIFLSLFLVGSALGLVLYTLRDQIIYFYTPSQALQKAHQGERVRIGGLVEEGSVKKLGNQLVLFTLTDKTSRLKVEYQGSLPDLFREGQGIIADGILGENNVLKAQSVLAKHDEYYMPADLADSLKQQGYWKPPPQVP